MMTGRIVTNLDICRLRTGEMCPFLDPEWSVKIGQRSIPMPMTFRQIEPHLLKSVWEIITTAEIQMVNRKARGVLQLIPVYDGNIVLVSLNMFILLSTLFNNHQRLSKSTHNSLFSQYFQLLGRIQLFCL